VTVRRSNPLSDPAAMAAEAGLERLPVRPTADRHTVRHSRGWFTRRFLAVADALALLVAFGVTELLFRHYDDRPGALGVGSELLIFAASIPVWIIAAKMYGLYDRDEERPVHSTADELAPVFHLVTVGVWIFAGFSWVTGLATPEPRKLATFWLLAILALLVARSGARALARRHSSYPQNTVVVGAGDIGQLLGRKLVQHPEYGLHLVGFVDTEPKAPRHGHDDLRLLGEPSAIVDIIARHHVDRVIIAYSRERHEELLELIHALRSLNVQIDVVPRLFDALTPRVSVHMVEGFPLLGLTPARIPRSSRFLKRTLDVMCSALLLLLTVPLMAAIALLVHFDSPGPVFFRQKRLGLDMKEFTLLKFRTMRDGTDADAHRQYIRDSMDRGAAPTATSLYKLPRHDAITRVGGWLRKTSLDEWPQLINVLRGDMSLVGPRPCIPYETEVFAPHHFERFLVPAGLTGLWQVEARAHSTFGEALDLDVAYARGWSFGLDLRLLLRTPLLMFRKKETG
jgi:exopolysaccharide biosynthesis polyprenyl glycosylphosphotransferase